MLVILVIVFIDAIGIGLILPILPNLIVELGAGDHKALIYAGLVAGYALAQFICAPILGALSDTFGRRPILAISLLGGACDYALMSFAPALWLIVVGRILAGMTGANMTVATAYLTDVTSEADRGKVFGRMSACFGLGFIVGPALGGLVGEMHPRYPFMLAAIFNAALFLLTVFALREPVRHDRPIFSRTTLDPFSAIPYVRASKVLPWLVAIFALVQLSAQVPNALWIIYGQDVFRWTSRLVGLSFAVFGLLHAITQAFLTAPLQRFFGDTRLLVFAIAMDTLANFGFAFVTDGKLAFAVIPLFALGALATPSLQAIVTKYVASDKQGEVQGLLVSVTSLLSVIAPLAVSLIYVNTLAHWPGWVWIFAMACYPLCLPLLRRANLRNNRRRLRMPKRAHRWNGLSCTHNGDDGPVAGSPESYITRALQAAESAAAAGEVPVAAILVIDGREFTAENEKERRPDPTAHAEMLVIQAAAQALGRWRLDSASLYITKEPCVMCAGAIVAARIASVYFGAYDPKAGAAGSVIDVFASAAVNHRPDVLGGVCGEAAAFALTNFFRLKRLRRE